MASCTGCGATNTGILRPNLSCPPDLSQLLFRFIERKRLGVVKGKQDLASFDMSQLFVPLNGYLMTQWNICKDTSMKIEAGSAMDFGERRQIAEFDLSTFPNATLQAGATIDITVMENGSPIDTLTGIAADDYTLFISNLKDALTASSTIGPLLEFHTDDETSTFSLRARAKGKVYIFILQLNDGANIETIAGVVTQTALRYPNGAWKLMFLNVLFCSDCKESNKLYLEYAYDSDVIANGESGATWRKLGPMLILTGAEDVTETDENKIESLWLRNSRDCDVEVQAILAT